MAKKDRYVKEMPIWLDQQRLRLKSCKESIAACLKQIAISKQLIDLEQKQGTIIRQVIKAGEKELAKYLAKKRSKKK